MITAALPHYASDRFFTVDVDPGIGGWIGIIFN